MTKKIAVVVRDRQAEALRMAIGLTLMDDDIDIYILTRKLLKNAEMSLNIETVQDLELDIYSNFEQGSGVKFITGPELANALLRYDHILPY